MRGPWGTRWLTVALALALAVAVLPSLPALADTDELTVHLTPAIAGNTAVTELQRVLVSGQAPEGTIASAQLRAVHAEGSIDEGVSPTVLNRAPREDGDWLRIHEGQLEGRLTLSCAYGPPTSFCNDQRRITDVELAVTVEGQTAVSPPLRVDFTRPFIREYRLVAPDLIRVVFSEPVRHPQGETTSDWRVTQPTRFVTEVLGPLEGDCEGEYLEGEDPRAGPTGCTLGLRLASSVGQDDRPHVEYRPPGLIEPGRDPHIDYASNGILFTVGAPTSNAVNRVRPRRPAVQAIEGRAPQGDGPQVLGNNPQPSVRVGEVTQGHQVFFRITRANGSELVTDDQPFTAPSTGAHTITLPVPIITEGSGDGDYRIQPVVRDPHGNLSTDTGKTPPAADQSPNEVTYTLDTVRPRVLSATQTGPQEVTVALSEPVQPAGGAGTWRVNGEAVPAAGSGDARVLTLGADLPAGSVLSWEPGDQPYTDAAGNTLVPVEGLPIAPLPPVGAPTVTVPDGERYTNEHSATLGGQGPTATVVEVLRQGQDDVVAEGAVSGGTWSAAVPLGQDGRHRFEARARNPETGARSARVGAPDIVRDTSPPDVDVHQPTLRSLLGDGCVPLLDPDDCRRRYAVGDPVTVEWEAADPAPGGDDHGDRVRVDVRLDGAEPRVFADDEEYVPGRRSTLSYTLTEDDLGGLGTRETRFGVAVTDLAGNVGQAVSDPILLVGDLIGYTPVYTEPAAVDNLGRTRIEARFPMAMQGGTSRFDWSVWEDGEARSVSEAATTVDADGRTVVVIRVLGVTDPNARMEIGYTPAFPTLAELREAGGARTVSTVRRPVVDGVPPALSVTPPPGGPLNAGVVTLTGSTDETAHPNEVLVYRMRDGRRSGPPVATTTASGSFSLQVPLQRDRANQLQVEAVDPAGNNSPARTFTVIEDSTAPEVTITAPAAGSGLPEVVPIRWSTIDAHPYVVELAYRVDGGSWHQIAWTEDTGAHDWERPALAEGARVDLRVKAIDRAGNQGAASVEGLTVGPVPVPPGIPPLPTTLRAVATSERTIELHFGDPVDIGAAPAGLSVRGGPGVAAVEGGGAHWVLRLNSDLETNTPELVSNGTGIRLASGGDLPSFRVVAERGFAFAPQGLGAAAGPGDAVRLSWVDDRNVPAEVVRYEVRRDGEPVAQLPADARGWVDVGSGTERRTYEVRAIDDLDHVSHPATTTIDPLAPNITPQGGFVLSDDGEVALLVPAGAVDRDHWGTLTPVADIATGGFAAVGGGYALRAEAAGDGAPLERFGRYACLSFRPGGERLDQTERDRLMGLRLGAGDRAELATRAGHGSATSCILTLGDFALGQAEGATTRVFGPDPAIPADRFATAAGLSQSSFAQAGEAIIARADDFPDALASASLAAQVGGPVLLATSRAMPAATSLELRRLGVHRVTLIGGPSALNESVAAQARAMGLEVRRVAGANRFETAVEVAKLVGSYDGSAYLATGQSFADALAASSSSAYLGRPILLAARDVLPAQTVGGLEAAGIDRLDILGGPSAVSAGVEQQLRAHGLGTRRISGSDRFATALSLAQSVADDGMALGRPIAASGQGVGTTSPDALAAGPIAARFGSPLLLVARDFLHEAVAEAVSNADGLRAVTIAGGPSAVSPATRAGIDAAAR